MRQIYNVDSVLEDIFNIKPTESIKIDFITENRGLETSRYMIIRTKDSGKIIIPIKIDCNMSLPVAIWETISKYVNNHYNINCTGYVSCIRGEIKKNEEEYESDDIVKWDNYPCNPDNSILIQRNLAMIELPEGMTESEANKILEDYKKNISKKTE